MVEAETSSSCTPDARIFLPAHTRTGTRQTGDLRGKVNNLISTHIGVKPQFRPDGRLKQYQSQSHAGKGTLLSPNFISRFKGLLRERCSKNRLFRWAMTNPTTLEGISIGKDGSGMRWECQRNAGIRQARRPNRVHCTIDKRRACDFCLQLRRNDRHCRVPYPAAARDHGCALIAVRLTPRFELAMAGITTQY